MKRMYVCNVEIRIEETLSLLKVKAGIKEKAKISITAITGNKQLQQAITADEPALLLTGSKKSWMYQLLFFIISLRYFVDYDLNS